MLYLLSSVSKCSMLLYKNVTELILFFFSLRIMFSDWYRYALLYLMQPAFQSQRVSADNHRGRTFPDTHSISTIQLAVILQYKASN